MKQKQQFSVLLKLQQGDLQSCADYLAGDTAVTNITCPCAMILAGQDKMTPLKAGLKVADSLAAELTVLKEYGHMLPMEAPKKVLHALREFIVATEA